MFNFKTVCDMKLIITFYLRTNHLTKNQEYPIMLRVGYGGKRMSFGSTGYNLPLDFMIKNNRVSRRDYGTSGIHQYNKILAHIEHQIRVQFENLRDKGIFSLSNLKSAYLHLNNERDENLLVLFSKEITQNISNHNAIYMKKKLSLYLNELQIINDIDFRNVTNDFVVGFYNWMLLSGSISVRTANEYISSFKSVYRSIVKKYRMNLDDPFDGFILKKSISTKSYLTEDELNTLCRYNLRNQKLIKARDYFLFACYTGLAYIDVSTLKKEHIRQIAGRTWIQKPRQKTKVLSNIFVINKAQELIDKYEREDSDFIFPEIPKLGTLLNHLHKLAEECNIRDITYHLGRHTFATMALSKGVAIESVSKVLGHTNITTTQQYAKIINKKVETDMLLFEASLNQRMK